MIYAQRKQRTIAAPAVVQGFGYWSSRDVRVEFRPAEAHTGLVFVRTDLPQQPRIAANIQNRIETPRRTTLSARGVCVEMVEHVLAALAGLQIDNCEIWVDQPEMPGCDGSSLPFVQALDAAGVVVQDADRPMLFVREITRLGGSDESWVEARPSVQTGMTVRFRLDYGADSAIGRQTIQLPISPESFRREICNCRTFMLKSEAEWLLAQGRGTRATSKDLLIYDAYGPVDNTLRFHDECVRHKVLDLIGDLALAGCDLVGHFIAYRSGHRLNADLARVLLAEGERIEGRRRRTA